MMSKIESINKNVKEMWKLSEAVTEIYEARDYLKKILKNNWEIELPYLQLLIKTAYAKLEYLEDKYGFEVSKDDVFFIENIEDFMQARQKLIAQS